MKNIVSSLVYRVYNSVYETNTLYVNLYSHILFTQYKSKVVSTLWITVLGILDRDMLLLYFLECILDNNFGEIDSLPESIIVPL